MNWRRLGRTRKAIVHLAAAVAGTWALFIVPEAIIPLAAIAVSYYLYAAQRSDQSRLAGAGPITGRAGWRAPRSPWCRPSSSARLAIADVITKGWMLRQGIESDGVIAAVEWEHFSDFLSDAEEAIIRADEAQLPKYLQLAYGASRDDLLGTLERQLDALRDVLDRL